MTLREANAILVPPLKFGDPEQIAAADFVALYEESLSCLLIEGFSEGCDDCNGAGKTECECACGKCSHDVECEKCKGVGVIGATRETLTSMNETQLGEIVRRVRFILADEQVAA